MCGPGAHVGAEVKKKIQTNLQRGGKTGLPVFRGGQEVTNSAPEPADPSPTTAADHTPKYYDEPTPNQARFFPKTLPSQTRLLVIDNVGIGGDVQWPVLRRKCEAGARTAQRPHSGVRPRRRGRKLNSGRGKHQETPMRIST